ncbi:MAG: TadE/TadG family type IV pilus assembly protein [Sciscionella sp.]
MTTRAIQHRLTAARRHACGRGSATVELVLLTPLLILFVLFTVGLGRLAHARALVNDAAAQAARAATLHYLDPGQAAAAAQQTASDALAAAGLACASQNTSVQTGDDRAGGTITVSLTCRVDLSSVTAAGFPGATTLQASFTSPIDTYVPQVLGFEHPAAAVRRCPPGGGSVR